MFKRILIILSIIFVLLLALLIVLPIIFQDDIKALVQKELSSSLEADVAFEDIGLNFFSSFPNACVGVQKLSIINRAPFKGDTLVYADALKLEVDFISLFQDEKKVIEAVLEDPVANILIKKDGIANYNIYQAEA